METLLGIPLGVLVIGPEEKEKLKKLKETAEANVLSFQTLMSGTPIGDNPNHAIYIPADFRVVYSVEEQPNPLGRCRHLSVSVSREGRVPHPASLKMIAEELGFRNDAMVDFAMYQQLEHGGNTPDMMMGGHGYFYSEPMSENRVAINFMERVEEPTTQ